MDKDKINRMVAGGLLATLALYMFFYLPRDGWDYNFGYGYGRDFINFWAAGRLASLGQSALLFDQTAYNVWLKGQFTADIGVYHIYSYPPSIIPLLIPFGMLPYGVALALWTGANIAAVVAAMRLVAANRRAATLLALAAPAIGLAAFQGQMTAALGALMFAALVTMDRRPILAGVLLGLLTIKPQLGVVVGAIALLERRYALIGATVATTLALVALSFVVVGPGAWIDYITKTLPVQNAFLTGMSAGFTYFLLTPYALFRTLGLGGSAAMALHVLTAGAFCAFAIHAWLRRTDACTPTALTVVALASVVATPYANLYDLTLVALPLAALHAQSIVPPAWARHTLWYLPALGLPLALVLGPIWGVALVLAGAAMIAPSGVFAGPARGRPAVR